MSRYRRVNIDGKSLFKTETRRIGGAVALLPGTFVIIDAATDTFLPATAKAVGRVYILGAAESQGLGIRQPIPAGDSAVGNYVEQGREFAVLCPAGTYKKDTAIAVAADGGVITTVAAETIGFSQDDVILTAPDFVRVRIRGGV